MSCLVCKTINSENYHEKYVEFVSVPFFVSDLFRGDSLEKHSDL